MKAQIDIPYEIISEFCRRWEIKELSLFGSVLEDHFSSDSDVDILVNFKKDTRHNLFDMVHMKEELEAILGRRVDLISQRGLENSQNHLRKKEILESAQTIYGT